MRPNYSKFLKDVKKDFYTTSKEEFYSDAIKYQIQLLWMQTPFIKLCLVLVLVANAAVPLTLVLLSITGVSTISQSVGLNAPSHVVVLSLVTLLSFLVPATYAFGLLIYGRRIKNASRKKMTIIADSELSLTPIEVAALLGRADRKSEAWYIIYRFVETGNVRLLRDDVDGQWKLQRIGSEATMSKLEIYERQFLVNWFPPLEQVRAELSRHLTPDRLRVLNVGKQQPSLLLERVNTLSFLSSVASLNEQVRKGLIADGVFQPLRKSALWWQSLLYATMGAMTPFAIIAVFSVLPEFLERSGMSAISFSPLNSLDYGYLVAIVLFVMIGGVWFLTTDIYSRFGLNEFIEAQGLLLYLQVAMRDRLRQDGLGRRETLRFLPYAQVLGLHPIDTDELIARMKHLAQQ